MPAWVRSIMRSTAASRDAGARSNPLAWAQSSRCPRCEAAAGSVAATALPFMPTRWQNTMKDNSMASLPGFILMRARLRTSRCPCWQAAAACWRIRPRPSVCATRSRLKCENSDERPTGQSAGMPTHARRRPRLGHGDRTGAVCASVDTGKLRRFDDGRLQLLGRRVRQRTGRLRRADDRSSRGAFAEPQRGNTLAAPRNRPHVARAFRTDWPRQRCGADVPGSAAIEQRRATALRAVWFPRNHGQASLLPAGTRSRGCHIDGHPAVSRRDLVLNELGLSPLWVRRDGLQAAASAAAVDRVTEQKEPAPRVESAPPADRAGQIRAMDWAQLESSASACKACVLHKARKQAVLGVGDENAEWLFVGEGPGAEEDERGEPFVGQAGKLLDNMLAAIALQRGKNVYIANIVKCRPPGNR